MVVASVRTSAVGRKSPSASARAIVSQRSACCPWRRPPIARPTAGKSARSKGHRCKSPPPRAFYQNPPATKIVDVGWLASQRSPTYRAWLLRRRVDGNGSDPPAGWGFHPQVGISSTIRRQHRPRPDVMDEDRARFRRTTEPWDSARGVLQHPWSCAITHGHSDVQHPIRICSSRTTTRK